MRALVPRSDSSIHPKMLGCGKIGVDIEISRLSIAGVSRTPAAATIRATAQTESPAVSVTIRTFLVAPTAPRPLPVNTSSRHAGLVIELRSVFIPSVAIQNELQTLQSKPSAER